MNNSTPQQKCAQMRSWPARRQDRCRPRWVAAFFTVALVFALAQHNVAAADADTNQTAQTLKNLSFEELMEVKVATVYGASKHEQKTAEAPSSVSIVKRRGEMT